MITALVLEGFKYKYRDEGSIFKCVHFLFTAAAEGKGRSGEDFFQKVSGTLLFSGLGECMGNNLVSAATPVMPG